MKVFNSLSKYPALFLKQTWCILINFILITGGLNLFSGAIRLHSKIIYWALHGGHTACYTPSSCDPININFYYTNSTAVLRYVIIFKSNSGCFYPGHNQLIFCTLPASLPPGSLTSSCSPFISQISPYITFTTQYTILMLFLVILSFVKEKYLVDNSKTIK